MGMPMRVAGVVLSSALGAAVMACPGSGWAHAIIIESAPAAGSRVQGPMIDFHLQYNSRIDARRSRLILDLPDGSYQSLSIRPDTSLDTLAAEAKGLSPGHYRLHWQVLSVDGHITRGDIPFDVAP